MLSRKPVFKKIGITSWKIENTEPIKVTFKKAIPIALESGFWQMSAIVMTKVILVFGTDAYAGYSLASSAETLTELPVIGFTVAATTLAGKALGEKNGFDPHLSQCVVNKPCTGGLSIGSRHSKQFQLLGWIAKKCCTQLAVYLSCIRKQ